jgi:hypothetical protein
VQSNKDADKLCEGSVCRTQQGVDDANSAGKWATWSTVAFSAGAGLAAVGIIMIFAAPKPLPSTPGPASLTLVPQLSPTGGAMSLTGSF